MNNEETQFIKKVSVSEYKLTHIINSFDICPKIITSNKDLCLITFEKYDFTVLDFLLFQNPNNYEIHTIKQQIKDLVTKLHLNGIFHGDIHLDNIVLKIENNNIKVKLIDFGLSKVVHNINESEINRTISIYNSLYKINPFALSIDDLMKWEITIIDDLFKIE